MERGKIVKFLKNPKNYPHQVRNVRHLETYISDIFLTGNFAYKMKKPVNFGYLDFTTLGKRKFFCQQELKLNRRLAKEIYLEVLPIVERGGKIRTFRFAQEPCSRQRKKYIPKIKIKGRGKPIEYVLKMKEVKQKFIMGNLLKRRRISKKNIERIAKIMANFHRIARASKKISYFGSLKNIKRNWNENFSQTKAFINKTISRKSFYFIKNSIEEFIRKNRKVFHERIKEKKIRDCHGDLQVNNIFVTPGKIYIFDCIEFNQRFRYSDVASEVAFLAMDLDFLNRKDLANYFIEKYIAYAGDRNLRRVLLFYKCYRAYVKGKVLGFHPKKRNLAKKYFILADSYAKKWQEPILIIGAGLPGIGKSKYLDLLAEEIRAKILKSDLIRKEILPQVNYQEKSKMKVYQEMIRRSEKFLKKGKGVILDATFSKKIYRQLARKMARKLKTPCYLIEFVCPEKIALKRIKLREKNKKAISQADIQVYRKIKTEFEPIHERENYFQIDTSKDIKKNMKELIKKISIC